jgi:hypothetical protein
VTRTLMVTSSQIQAMRTVRSIQSISHESAEARAAAISNVNNSYAGGQNFTARVHPIR